MRDPDSLKELKSHIDAVNEQLVKPRDTYPDRHILVDEKLHFAIKMLARRHHKTISGVATELLTAGIKATYYKLYMEYIRGPEKTFVDFKKAEEG